MLSGKAENSYPSKVILNEDTVICSTVAQQKQYLIWKSELSHCKEREEVHFQTIGLMDSMIKSQSKLITVFENQVDRHKQLVSKIDESAQLQADKYKMLETAYKVQAKRERRRSFITGLSLGGISLAIGGLLIYQLVKP